MPLKQIRLPGLLTRTENAVPGFFERIHFFGVCNVVDVYDDAVTVIGNYQNNKLDMRFAYSWPSEQLG